MERRPSTTGSLRDPLVACTGLGLSASPRYARLVAAAGRWRYVLVNGLLTRTALAATNRISPVGAGRARLHAAPKVLVPYPPSRAASLPNSIPASVDTASYAVPGLADQLKLDLSALHPSVDNRLQRPATAKAADTRVAAHEQRCFSAAAGLSTVPHPPTASISSRPTSAAAPGLSRSSLVKKANADAYAHTHRAASSTHIRSVHCF